MKAFTLVNSSTNPQFDHMTTYQIYSQYKATLEDHRPHNVDKTGTLLANRTGIYFSLRGSSWDVILGQYYM